MAFPWVLSAALACFLSLTFQQEGISHVIKKCILLLCWQEVNQLLGQKCFSETWLLNHSFDQRPAQSTFFLLQTGAAQSLDVLEALIKDKAKCVWKQVNGIFWSAGSLYFWGQMTLCPNGIFLNMPSWGEGNNSSCLSWGSNSLLLLSRGQENSRQVQLLPLVSLCLGAPTGHSSRTPTAVLPLWPGCKWEPTCSPWPSKMRGTCKARALWMSLSKKVYLAALGWYSCLWIR